MQLAPGTRLGAYEILQRIGAGGMGEVFKARDTRLDRFVAIKVLSAAFSDDPQLIERFDREARAISQLGHQNICTLHDVGYDSGVHYLVMELLDGETLADRLARGPLPIATVLRYGAEIAGALDRAHRAGIVHRDLKPANIIITKSGTKLVDFGLAKSATIDVEADADGATQRMPLTRPGTILGTFQYMAPEQLEGENSDARSDIFALGAVLYEMATGRRAFEGSTKTSLIAAIVDRSPTPISEIQPLTPPALEHVVTKCLEKNPDMRWQSAFDVAEELRWTASAVAAQPVRSLPWRERLLWIAAILSLIAGLAVILRRGSTAKSDSIVARIPLAFPGAMAVGSIALSPDGRTLAFAADAADGQRLLWIRSLNAEAGTAIAMTNGAQYPFWSPDGRYLAFFADGRLKKVDVEGGTPQTLCTVRNGRGGTWNRSGVILFARTGSGPLHRISAEGGPSHVVTEVHIAQGLSTHRWPLFLPDGRHFLYLATTFGTALDRSQFGIYAGDLQSKLQKKVLSVNSNFAYADGRLLYVRDGTLYSHDFDAERLEVKGDPTPLAAGISYARIVAWAEFAAAPRVLVYQSGRSRDMTKIAWFDRGGTPEKPLTEPGYVVNPSIAPDGSRIALNVADTQTTNTDIWLFGSSSDSRQRLTFSAAEDSNAVWSGDGTWLAYNTYDGGRQVISRSAASGRGEQLVVYRGGPSAPNPLPTDISPDGKWIVFQNYNAESRDDLMLVTSDGGDEATKLIATPAAELGAQISPDGQWLAFTSDETGRFEIYVTRFPIAQPKWQVSSDGGREPRWRGDGKELFYIDRAKRIVSVAVRSGDVPQFTAPLPLFRPPVRDALSGTDIWSYDAAPDGNSFAVNIVDSAAYEFATTLWLDWEEDVKVRRRR